MSVPRPIWLNLAILAAFGLQADVVFGQVFNGLQKQAGVNRSGQGPHYFTIMGHIAHPNCYELPTASPSLVSFVEFAGNPTETAAGSIRIVRDGRTIQPVFYRDKLTEILVPGDILVVDGKINQGRIIHRGNQNSTYDGTAEVSLAITGIRDYPVVLEIPSERATIRWVTRHLGLDPGAANNVKAITQRQSQRVFPDTRLFTGTVLAFNPAYVDQSRLPDDLRVPVKSGRSTSTPAQPLLPTGPVAQHPLTGPPSNQYSAAPGRARVPTIGVNPPAAAARTKNFDLTPDEQTFVKQLLTDPGSVPLDEPVATPSGRVFVPESTMEASPEATRPYNSTPATPESLQPLGSSAVHNAGTDTEASLETTAVSNLSTTNIGNESAPSPSTSPVRTPSSAKLNDPVQSAQQPDTISKQTAPLATTNYSADGSRLLPPPPGGPNWPVISICVVGLLGTIAASFLIYSIAHEKPAPRVAQINTSGRYWLDRMIENDIPIEDETVNFPHNTQLFGKPAPIQRVDAAHRAVPRPHFSAPGGKSGVLKENPAMPDAPAPDISDTDHKRIVKLHAGGSAQMQGAAAIPTPHSVGTAAERRENASGVSEFAETVVYGDAGQLVDSAASSGEPATSDEATISNETSSKKKPGRHFRLDTGHSAADQKTTDEKLRTPGQSVPRRKPVAVQPSPVVVQGANLLDRILSSVEHEQTVARPKAAASNRDKRKSDERGQS